MFFSPENGKFYPHFLQVLLCGAEKRLKDRSPNIDPRNRSPRFLRKVPLIFFPSFRNFSFAHIFSGELFQLQLSSEGWHNHGQQWESALNVSRCSWLAQAVHWAPVSNLHPQRARSLQQMSLLCRAGSRHRQGWEVPLSDVR